MENGIPFEVKAEIPNAETVAAIEEGRKLLEDKNTKVYHDIDELRRALDV